MVGDKRPAPAGTAGEATGCGDATAARLNHLDRCLRALDGAMLENEIAREEADRHIARDVPPPPAVPHGIRERIRDPDPLIEAQMRVRSVRAADALVHGVPSSDPVSLEIEAALSEYLANVEDAYRRLDYGRFEACEAALRKAQGVAQHELLLTPARSMKGLLAKLRQVDWALGPEREAGDYTAMLLREAVCDVERLVRGIRPG